MLSQPWRVIAVLDSADLLARCARFGPFFLLRTGPHVADWSPIRSLSESAELDADVERIRSVLGPASADGSGGDHGAVSSRVAASVLFLGWAARLLSPVVGCAVLAGAVPDYGDLRRQPGSNPLALGLTGPTWHAGETVEVLGAEVREHVLDTTVFPLAQTISDRFAVSEQVMAGNVASAIAGTAGQIVAAEPARSEQVNALTDALLAEADLGGAGDFTRLPSVSTQRRFRRRSCCLYYRVPGASYCADCILAGSTATDRHNTAGRLRRRR